MKRRKKKTRKFLEITPSFDNNRRYVSSVDDETPRLNESFSPDVVLTEVPTDINKSFLIAETQRHGYSYQISATQLENKKSIYRYVFGALNSEEEKDQLDEEILVNDVHSRKLQKAYNKSCSISKYLLFLLKNEGKNQVSLNVIKRRKLESRGSITTNDSDSMERGIKDFNRVWYDPSGNWLREVAELNVENDKIFLENLNMHKEKLKMFALENTKVGDSTILKDIKNLNVKLGEQERVYFKKLYSSRGQSLDEFVESELKKYKEKLILDEMEKIKLIRMEREKERKMKLAKKTAKVLRDFLQHNRVERIQRKINNRTKERCFAKIKNYSKVRRLRRKTLLVKSFQLLKSNVWYMYLLKKKLRAIFNGIQSKRIVRVTFNLWKNYIKFKRIKKKKKLFKLVAKENNEGGNFLMDNQNIINQRGIAFTFVGMRDRNNLNGVETNQIEQFDVVQGGFEWESFLEKQKRRFIKTEKSRTFYRKLLLTKCFFIIMEYSTRKKVNRKKMIDFRMKRDISLKKNVIQAFLQNVIQQKSIIKPNIELKRKFFTLWLRQNYLDRLRSDFEEETLVRIKKVCFFWMWKKKFLKKKLKETYIMTKVLLNQPLALWTLSMLNNDKIQFNMLDKYKRLKKFFLARRFLKVYISIIYQRYEMDLKRYYFSVIKNYAQFVDDEIKRPEMIEKKEVVVENFCKIRNTFFADYEQRNVLAGNVNFRNRMDTVNKYYEKWKTRVVNDNKRGTCDNIVLRNLLILLVEYKKQKKILLEIRNIRSKLIRNEINRENIKELNRKEKSLLLMICNVNRKPSFGENNLRDDIKELFGLFKFKTKDEEDEDFFGLEPPPSKGEKKKKKQKTIFEFIAGKVKKNHSILRNKLPRDRKRMKTFCKKTGLKFQDKFEGGRKKFGNQPGSKRNLFNKFKRESEDIAQQRIRERFDRDVVLNFVHEGMLQTLIENQRNLLQKHASSSVNLNLLAGATKLKSYGVGKRSRIPSFSKRTQGDVFDMVLGNRKRMFEFFRKKQKKLKQATKENSPKIIIHEGRNTKKKKRYKKKKGLKNRSSVNLKVLRDRGNQGLFSSMVESDFSKKFLGRRDSFDGNIFEGKRIKKIKSGVLTEKGLRRSQSSSEMLCKTRKKKKKKKDGDKKQEGDVIDNNIKEGDLAATEDKNNKEGDTAIVVGIDELKVMGSTQKKEKKKKKQKGKKKKKKLDKKKRVPIWKRSSVTNPKEEKKKTVIPKKMSENTHDPFTNPSVRGKEEPDDIINEIGPIPDDDITSKIKFLELKKRESEHSDYEYQDEEIETTKEMDASKIIEGDLIRNVIAMSIRSEINELKEQFEMSKELYTDLQKHLTEQLTKKRMIEFKKHKEKQDFIRQTQNEWDRKKKLEEEEIVSSKGLIDLEGRPRMKLPPRRKTPDRFKFKKRLSLYERERIRKFVKQQVYIERKRFENKFLNKEILRQRNIEKKRRKFFFDINRNVNRHNIIVSNQTILRDRQRRILIPAMSASVKLKKMDKKLNKGNEEQTVLLFPKIVKDTDWDNKKEKRIIRNEISERKKRVMTEKFLPLGYRNFKGLRKGSKLKRMKMSKDNLARYLKDSMVKKK